MAFSPVEALRLDVEGAAARWSLATGCDVVVADGGKPVELVASIRRPDGTQAPGWTSEDRSRIEINVRMREGAARARTVAHEVGHALGGEHVGRGVLSGEKGYDDVIDSAALESVCARLSCPAVSPEAW